MSKRHVSLAVVNDIELQKIITHVDNLEASGGNLIAFCKSCCTEDNSRKWLFQIQKDIEKYPEQAKRWREAITRGLEIRLDCLQARALEKLETWSNTSETNSASEIAYAKTILADILTGRIEHAKRRAAQPFMKELKDLMTKEIKEETNEHEEELLEELRA